MSVTYAQTPPGTLSGATVVYGPQGLTFDIKAALVAGAGSFDVDDSTLLGASLRDALDASPVVHRTGGPFPPPNPHTYEMALVRDDGVVVRDDQPKTPVAPWLGLANIVSFGAVGDGATDDTAAIVAAVAFAAAAGGGAVQMPAGVYAISDVIAVPGDVALVGDGSRATVLKAIDPAAGIIYGSGTVGGALTDVFGVSQGWRFDGNLLSTVGLILSTIDGHFADIQSHGVDGDAITVLGQNNTFVSCTAADSNGAGIVLDNGAGGNVFLRCWAHRTTGFNVEFRSSAASTSGAYAVPEYNYFYGCLTEYCGSPSFGTSTAGPGNIRHLAGAWNYLLEHQTYCNNPAGTNIKYEVNPVVGRSGVSNGRLFLRNASLIGGSGAGAGIWADNVVGGVAQSFVTDAGIELQGRTIFSGVGTAIKWGTTSSIVTTGDEIYYGGPTKFSPQGTGAFAVLGTQLLDLTFPTFTSPWANLGGGTSQAYFYRRRGRVYLGGFIAAPGGAYGTAAFTLPAGMRPSLNLYFPAYSSGNANAAMPGFVGVDTAGVVTPLGGGLTSSGDKPNVALDGISFYVG